MSYFNYVEQDLGEICVREHSINSLQENIFNALNMRHIIEISNLFASTYRTSRVLTFSRTHHCNDLGSHPLPIFDDLFEPCLSFITNIFLPNRQHAGSSVGNE